MKKYALVMVVVLSVAVVSALGDTITYQNGLNGYTGCVDTKLSSSAPTTNYATGTLLSTNVASPVLVDLIKFGNLSLPENAVITKAQLIVSVVNAYDSGNVYLWAMQKDWVVTSATWNTTNGTTAWSTAGAQGADDRGSAAIAQFAVVKSTPGYATIDLPTNLVQSWIDTPSSNYGLQFAPGAHTDIASSDYYLAMKEQRPTLYIEYSTVPEPASMGLVLAGVFGIITARKRK